MAYWQNPVTLLRKGGGGEGASGGMLPQIILILILLKCQEMHFKLINEFLNYYTVASVPDRS